ncbi:MAG TPA: hypothetical protein VFZ93_08565 [Albitalea sp.]
MKLQNGRSARLSAFAAAIAIAAATVTLGPVQAWAQAHEHDHGPAVPARLGLDQGRKWATDAPLRSGMERIRALVQPQLAGARAGKPTPAQYAALAREVETEVGGIVANCRLEPKADAMLHLVIADIGAGTDAMAGKAPALRPEQGLVKVAAALSDYARHFDHPGFAPLRASD